jgi:hypothetical protein
MSVRRDWCPQPEMRARIGRDKTDRAKEQRRWVERHPVVKETAGIFLIRFTSDEQLTDLLAGLVRRNRSQSGYGVSVTALEVLQRPREEKEEIETCALRRSYTRYVEGRVLVCLS